MGDLQRVPDGGPQRRRKQRECKPGQSVGGPGRGDGRYKCDNLD